MAIRPNCQQPMCKDVVNSCHKTIWMQVTCDLGPRAAVEYPYVSVEGGHCVKAESSGEETCHQWHLTAWPRDLSFEGWRRTNMLLDNMLLEYGVFLHRFCWSIAREPHKPQPPSLERPLSLLWWQYVCVVNVEAAKKFGSTYSSLAGKITVLRIYKYYSCSYSAPPANPGE